MTATIPAPATSVAPLFRPAPVSGVGPDVDLLLAASGLARTDVSLLLRTVRACDGDRSARRFDQWSKSPTVAEALASAGDW